MLLSSIALLAGFLWACVFVQNVPSIARMVGKGGNNNDPLHASLGFLSFVLVMFTSASFIFGRHMDVMTSPEVAYRTACFILSVASASVTLLVGRTFGKST